MRLIIEENQQDVGVWVASYIRKRIRDFKPTAERPFVLGLPTGNSPLPTYRKLIEFHRAGELRCAATSVSYRCAWWRCRAAVLTMDTCAASSTW